jgi:hypothetical protein
MHAFDSHTGKLLWEATLPFAGHATPATYMLDGKQYVVIAAGGGRDPEWSSGGVCVAFALPRQCKGSSEPRPRSCQPPAHTVNDLPALFHVLMMLESGRFPRFSGADSAIVNC